MKMTQFGKTGSICYFFAENWSPLSKLETDHVYRDLYNFAVW